MRSERREGALLGGGVPAGRRGPEVPLEPGPEMDEFVRWTSCGLGPDPAPEAVVALERLARAAGEMMERGEL